MPTFSGTTPSIAAGANWDNNFSLPSDVATITKIKVTMNTVGDDFTVFVYRTDAFATATMAYKSDAITTATYVDPVQDPDGTPTERTGSLTICNYEDDDATQELHFRITNGSGTTAKTFDYEIEYRALVYFDSNSRVGIGTSSPAVLLDAQQSLGGDSVVIRSYNTNSSASAHSCIRAVTAGSGEARFEFADNAAFRARITADANDDLSIDVGSGAGTTGIIIRSDGGVEMPNLSTADPLVNGELWWDGTNVKRSTG